LLAFVEELFWNAYWLQMIMTFSEMTESLVKKATDRYESTENCISLLQIALLWMDAS
jgi:hypothetical protein